MPVNPLRTTGLPLSQLFPQAPVATQEDPAELAPTSPLLAGYLGGDPMAAVAWNQQLGQLAAQNAAQTQAGQFFNEAPQYDTSTPEGQTGVQRLLSRYPQAAAVPAVKNYLSEQRIARLQQTRNAPLSPDAARFLTGLYSMDTTDPNAFASVQNDLRAHPEFLTDPRVSSHLEHIFKQQTAIARKPTKVPPHDLMREAAMADIPEEDLPKDANGDINEYETLRMIANSRNQSQARARVPAEGNKEILQLARGYTSPSDEDKQTAFTTAYPSTPFDQRNPQHWNEGFRLARQDYARKMQNLSDSFGIAGFKGNQGRGIPQVPSGIKVTRVK